MAASTDVKVIFRGDASGALKATGQLQRSMGGLSKLAKRAFVGLGVAAATGIGLAVRQGIKFESAFAGVRKTVDLSAKGFKLLARDLRNLSKEIPVSADELSGLGEVAGQLGIKGRKNLVSFIKTVAELGVTTNLAGEEGAKALARLANIMGTKGKKAFERSGSTIVDLGNNFATTEAEIVQFALRIAPTGKQVGLTEAQVLGLGAALSSLGINAEAGGTAISRVFTDMQVAVQRGGDELKVFADTAGVSVERFRKVFQEDAAQALVLFIEGLQKTKAQGGDLNQILEDLGFTNIRVRQAVLALVNGENLLNEALETGTRAWTENTALQEEAAKRFETTESRLVLLRNVAADLVRALGLGLLPTFKQLVNRAIEFAKSLDVERVEAFGRELGERIVAGIDKVIDGFQKIKGPLGDLLGDLRELGKVLKDAFGDSDISGDDLLQGATDAIREFVDFVNAHKDDLRGFFDTAAGVFSDVAAAAREHLPQVRDFILGMIGALRDLPGALSPIRGPLSAAFELAKKAAGGFDDAREAGEKFVEAYISLKGAALAFRGAMLISNPLIAVAAALATGAALQFGLFGDAVTKAAEKVKGALDDARDSVQALKDSFNAGEEAARRYEEAELRVEAAQLGLKEAMRARRQIQKEINADNKVTTDEELALESATLAVKQARLEDKRAAEDLATAGENVTKTTKDQTFESGNLRDEVLHLVEAHNDEIDSLDNIDNKVWRLANEIFPGFKAETRDSADISGELASKLHGLANEVDDVDPKLAGVISRLAEYIRRGEEIPPEILSELQFLFDGKNVTDVDFSGIGAVIGEDMGSGTEGGMRDKKDDIRSAAEEWAIAVSTMKIDLSGLGANAALSLAGGMTANVHHVTNAAAGLAAAATGAAMGVLKARSPSLVFFKIGQDTVQGFINGIKEKKDEVVDETKRMVAEMTRTAREMVSEAKGIAKDLEKADAFMSPRAVARVEKLFREIGKALRDKSITDDDLETIRRKIDRVGEIVEKGMERMREAVDAAAEDVGKEWDRLADLSLEAFDRMTEHMLDELEKNLDGQLDLTTEHGKNELERQKRDLEDQRDELRFHLEESLRELSDRLRDGEITAEEFRREYARIMERAGVDTERQAEIIGSALVDNLTRAFDQLVTNLETLIRTMGNKVSEGFRWGGRVWGPGQVEGFKQWLAEHGASYNRWCSSHPQACAILEGRAPTSLRFPTVSGGTTSGGSSFTPSPDAPSGGSVLPGAGGTATIQDGQLVAVNEPVLATPPTGSGPTPGEQAIIDAVINWIQRVQTGQSTGGAPSDSSIDLVKRFDFNIGLLAEQLRAQGFQKGGIVRGGLGGILAHIGEGRADELVMPLQDFPKLLARAIKAPAFRKDVTSSLLPPEAVSEAITRTFQRPEVRRAVGLPDFAVAHGVRGTQPEQRATVTLQLRGDLADMVEPIIEAQTENITVNIGREAEFRQREGRF